MDITRNDRDKGNSSVNWIASDKQIANCSTKCGVSPDLLLKVLSCEI